MPATTNGKPPPFFEETQALLDDLEDKIIRFSNQFEKSNDARKAVMREEGLKIQAKLAVLKAQLDASLDI